MIPSSTPSRPRRRASRGLVGIALALLLPVLATADGPRPPDPDHWAFRPVAPVTPPVPERHAGWPATPVDRFVLDRMLRAGLEPAAPASRAVWLRRVALDLTGLPPTPEELEAFVRDGRPDADARVVDRLLASPRHGARWARHWLDVVRFGESQGFEYDRIREHAWRYRDYVVDALNADLPYDQFIREQVAGDVHPAARPGAVVATGFLVAGPYDQAGNGAASASIRAAAREAELEDMVGTTAQSFLGLTLNCARCHAHKFDPIPQRDYYRVKAVLQGVRHGDRSLVTPEAARQRAEANAAVDRELAALAARIAAIDAAPHASLTNASGVPVPLARWSFSGDARDGVGTLHGELLDGAAVRDGRLVLDGRGARLRSPPLGRALGPHSLEAWVRVGDPDQRGGGVLSVEAPGGSPFDSIVYGEREPRRWIAGSESFVRTRDLGQPPEPAGPGEWIHLVVVHGTDGRVAVYRNARPYGASYLPDAGPGRAVQWPPETRVFLGQRHTGGGRPYFQGEVDEARLHDHALGPDEVARSFAAGPDTVFPSPRPALASADPRLASERASLVERQEALRSRRRAVPSDPMAYAANPEQPGATVVLARGEPDKPREPVTPGAPALFASLPGELGLDAGSPEGERRRRFADWIARADNPLTARVLVNRVWQHHFGRGIVATPNDFGHMGAAPTHPELLDWLARWFTDPAGGAWSLKRLHRMLVLSACYRQDSGQPPASDAENRWLSRFPVRRMEAEAARDTVLFVAGALNEESGGPGFRPFRHVGNGGQNEYFAADLPGAAMQRRTVYRIAVHSARDPLLDALDCPEFSTRTPVRPVTTTPLQALSMMNGSFVQRQSAALAERASARHPGDPAGVLRELWLRTLAREPRPDELRATRGLPAADVAWALLNSNEFLFVR